MTWSKAQRTTFLAAATKAGWTADQRYMVMRYAGCPSDVVIKRPTVSAVGNSGRHFRECMAIAESACAQAGVKLRPPAEHPSWNDACFSTRHEEEQFIRRVADEAVRRLPVHYNESLIRWAVGHVASENSNPLLPGVKPETLEQCDGPTVHRVAECLRAFVGRKFLECGLEPQSFEVPASARRRAEGSATSHQPSAIMEDRPPKSRARSKRAPHAQEISMNVGKVNVYTCPSGHETVTIDANEGVTPFMTRCRDLACTEMAESGFYRVDQTRRPTHEWLKPDKLDGLSDETIEHIRKGGLILRPIRHETREKFGFGVRAG
jgi:hypothetical protein